MYIRTREEALSAVAEILDLPQRRDQIVQSTVKIMLCLEAEPRSFLGDCQALIAACDRPEVAARIRELYPDTYDVVLLPIGFTSDILEPAARFLGLLKARAAIPMHFWEPADKRAFLDLLKDRQRPDGRRYAVRETGGPQWSLRESELPGDAVLVVGLSPASFDGWK